MTFGTFINILLVEDDTDLSISLSSYLTLAGYSVTLAGSCRECYAALERSVFHLALVDVSLPDQSGFVLAEYLRANTSLKVIILTAHERVEDRIRGYSSGAHNYFVKPVDNRELLAAIASLTQNEPQERVLSVEPTAETWQLLRKSWHLRTPSGAEILLTSLELQLLELLIAASGRVVPRDTLLAGLYSRKDEHSGRALDSLVRRLRGKISASGCQAPIKTAHAVGYCFSAPVTIA